jgi:hypothetical protein
MATEIQEQIVREAPDIESQKIALMRSAKSLADSANANAAQGQYLSPDYRVAGMNQMQTNALQAGQQGIGAYQPFLQGAQQGVTSGSATLGEAADVLRGADTRNQFGAAQQASGLAALGIMQNANPIGQQQIQQYMNPFTNLVLGQQLQEMNRQAQMQQQGLNAQAVQSGAFGGSRQAIAQQELNRNLMQTQNQAIAQALQGGYGQALSTAQQQQQAGLNAYGQLANVGQGIGSLANQQFGVGSQLAAGLGSLGTQQGNIGMQFGNLGQQAQGLGQQDVNFLYNLGSTQQRQDQALLDADRQNQLQRNMQPYQQAAFVSDIYKGAPSSQMSSMQQTQAAPSPFQQAAGLGIAGISAAAAANKAGLI